METIEQFIKRGGTITKLPPGRAEGCILETAEWRERNLKRGKVRHIVNPAVLGKGALWAERRRPLHAGEQGI